MNKKAYEQPTMTVVKIQQAQMLCLSNVETTGLDNGETLELSGEGDMSNAMSRGSNVWDDTE